MSRFSWFLANFRERYTVVWWQSPWSDCHKNSFLRTSNLVVWPISFWSDSVIGNSSKNRFAEIFAANFAKYLQIRPTLKMLMTYENLILAITSLLAQAGLGLGPELRGSSSTGFRALEPSGNSGQMCARQRDPKGGVLAVWDCLWNECTPVY